MPIGWISGSAPATSSAPGVPLLAMLSGPGFATPPPPEGRIPAWLPASDSDADLVFSRASLRCSASRLGGHRSYGLGPPGASLSSGPRPQLSMGPALFKISRRAKVLGGTAPLALGVRSSSGGSSLKPQCAVRGYSSPSGSAAALLHGEVIGGSSPAVSSDTQEPGRRTHRVGPRDASRGPERPGRQPATARTIRANERAGPLATFRMQTQGRRSGGTPPIPPGVDLDMFPQFAASGSTESAHCSQSRGLVGSRRHIAPRPLHFTHARDPAWASPLGDPLSTSSGGTMTPIAINALAESLVNECARVFWRIFQCSVSCRRPSPDFTSGPRFPGGGGSATPSLPTAAPTLVVLHRARAPLGPRSGWRRSCGPTMGRMYISGISWLRVVSQGPREPSSGTSSGGDSHEGPSPASPGDSPHGRVPRHPLLERGCFAWGPLRVAALKRGGGGGQGSDQLELRDCVLGALTTSLYSFSGCSPPTLLWPRRVVLCAGNNVVPAAEARLEVATSTIPHGRGAMSDCIGEMFSDSGQLLADGFSCRQFHSGALRLFPRLGRVRERPLCGHLGGMSSYTHSVLEGGAPRDHLPLETRFSYSCVARRRAIPHWVSDLPLFFAHVAEVVEDILHEQEDPFEILAVAADALRRVSTHFQRTTKLSRSRNQSASGVAGAR